MLTMVGGVGFEPTKAQGHLIYSQARLTASVPTHDEFLLKFRLTTFSLVQILRSSRAPLLLS